MHGRRGFAATVATDRTIGRVHVEFALSVRLPGVGCYRQAPDGLFFLAGDRSSWAQIAGGDTYRYGDRDLIAEVAEAVGWWRHNGRPRLSDYAVTVTVMKDDQGICLGDPSAGSWTSRFRIIVQIVS